LAGAPPKTPLGELTALPQPLSGLRRDPTSKGKGGERGAPNANSWGLPLVLYNRVSLQFTNKPE